MRLRRESRCYSPSLIRADIACQVRECQCRKAAKALDESASEAEISSPVAFAGTPRIFASPEQFAGVGVDIRLLDRFKVRSVQG